MIVDLSRAPYDKDCIGRSVDVGGGIDADYMEVFYSFIYSISSSLLRFFGFEIFFVSQIQ